MSMVVECRCSTFWQMLNICLDIISFVFLGDDEYLLEFPKSKEKLLKNFQYKHAGIPVMEIEYSVQEDEEYLIKNCFRV